jgi:hypothetical protein
MASINSYDIGDLVRITGALEDSEGIDIDPTAMFIQYKKPSGTIVTLQYGIDSSVIKQAVGIYYTNINADEAGHWHYRFYSTGVGQAAETGRFHVEKFG